MMGASLAVAARARAAAPIQDVVHIKLHGDKTTYCGHPRQGGIFNFGGGEIAVLHNHAPCAYQTRTDIQHDYGGYHSRSVLMLQRSLDAAAPGRPSTRSSCERSRAAGGRVEVPALRLHCAPCRDRPVQA